jgi:hypothetical protein
MNKYYVLESTPNIPYLEDNITNIKIQSQANIKSNWNYRQFMQKNANDIIKFNAMQSINASGNNPYTILNNNNHIQSSPFLYNSLHDTNNPFYGFRNSDLKQEYMNKQQMKAKMISPYIKL